MTRYIIVTPTPICNLPAYFPISKYTTFKCNKYRGVYFLDSSPSNGCPEACQLETDKTFCEGQNQAHIYS